MINMADYIKETNYLYDPDSGIAQVILTDCHGRLYSGIAICAEQDNDMKAEYTGYTIAEKRAWINFYKGWLRYEIKPQLRALKQLYYSMNRSKRFYAGHYEAFMLKRSIHRLEKQLTDMEDNISYMQLDLRDYIDNKDKLYKAIRAKRILEEDIDFNPYEAPEALDDVD